MSSGTMCLGRACTRAGCLLGLCHYRLSNEEYALESKEAGDPAGQQRESRMD